MQSKKFLKYFLVVVTLVVGKCCMVTINTSRLNKIFISNVGKFLGGNCSWDSEHCWSTWTGKSGLIGYHIAKLTSFWLVNTKPPSLLIGWHKKYWLLIGWIFCRMSSCARMMFTRTVRRELPGEDVLVKVNTRFWFVDTIQYSSLIGCYRWFTFSLHRSKVKKSTNILHHDEISLFPDCQDSVGRVSRFL